MNSTVLDPFTFTGFSGWQDLPRIELYMDQLISIIEAELLPLRLLGKENSITASMVNNYVKVKLVPAPHKKRYQRSHICALLMVFSLKAILSMQELSILLSALLDEQKGDWAELHALFCGGLKEALDEVFGDAEDAERKGADGLVAPAPLASATPLAPAALALEHAVRAFAHRLKALESLAGLAADAGEKNS